MPRSLWEGIVAFGLIHVPVALYPTAGAQELQLSLLDRRDLGPVGYRRVNARSGEEIEAGDVVRGYEYEPGHYVVVEEEDLRRANTVAAHTVDITGFVRIDEIAPQYFDTPYYLESGPGGEKGYALLREALRRTGRAGLAQVVIRTRQHLAAVFPVGEALLLNTLRFGEEVRAGGELRFPDENLQRLGVLPRELEMATRLVEVMAEAWVPDACRDTHRDDLIEVIRRKLQAGGEARAGTAALPPGAAAPALPAAAPAEPAPTSVDLLAMLRRSLEVERSARQAAAAARSVPEPAGGRSRRA